MIAGQGAAMLLDGRAGASTFATALEESTALPGTRGCPDLKPPFVPGSDACGEVVEAGPGVSRFKVGDRVVPTYTQGWIDGLPTPGQRAGRTPGVPLTGVLQDDVAVPAEDAVSAPAQLSDIEAATLPIAALTAWSTLQEGGVKPGDWVLVEGTGGVALFALQFAKLAGARVLALLSSEEKLRSEPERDRPLTDASPASSTAQTRRPRRQPRRQAPCRSAYA